jgi:hypothetical protein
LHADIAVRVFRRHALPSPDTLYRWHMTSFFLGGLWHIPARMVCRRDFPACMHAAAVAAQGGRPTDETMDAGIAGSLTVPDA